MQGTRKRVLSLFCLLLALGVLSACELAEKHEKTSMGTKQLTYLGKYQTSNTLLIGKVVTTEYDYYLVFNLLDDAGVATPIRVDITSGMYAEVTSLEGALEAEFYANGLGSVFILMGDQYFNVEDYLPEKAVGGRKLRDYDFVDQLYTPQD